MRQNVVHLKFSFAAEGGGILFEQQLFFMVHAGIRVRI